MKTSISAHKMRALCADFLDEMADRFGNDGCEDWDFPEDWTRDEQVAAERAYHEWNGDPEEFEASRPRGLQTSTAASLCAAWLRGEV